MADLEEKKDKFSAAINHYAEEQRQKIENEISDYQKKELEGTELEVLSECYQLIQKEIAQMRNGISREMARREMDARRKLLDRRSQITDEVFGKAVQKLKEYTGSGEYLAFLKSAAAQFATFGIRPGVVIRMKAEDAEYQKEIRDAFGMDCEFQTDSTIEIGGLKAFQPKMGILADETLDTLLFDQRGWFEAHSGMNVI